MMIRVGYELVFQVPARTPMLLVLYTHPSRAASLREADEVRAFAQQQPVEHLPPEVLPFLLGSRYCDVDKLTDVAWSLFGQTRLGWARVQTVCDWVHQNVQFGYQFASPFKSAGDVYQQR